MTTKLTGKILHWNRSTQGSLEGEVLLRPHPCANDGFDDAGWCAMSATPVDEVAGAGVADAVHAPQIEITRRQELLSLPVGSQVLRKRN